MASGIRWIRPSTARTSTLLAEKGGLARTLSGVHAAGAPRQGQADVLYLQRWSGGRPGSVQAVAPEGPTNVLINTD